MQDTFAVGDLEISKKVDPATLAAGDIITFQMCIRDRAYVETSALPDREALLEACRRARRS